MPKVAVIISILDGNASFDSCLEECQKQIDAVASEGRYSFSLFLNNEGPEGYQTVWKKAFDEGAELFFWLDHDLMLSEGSLASFLENSEFLRHKAVIAGTVTKPDRSLLFGGRGRRGRLIEPDSTIPVPCHYYDMALVLVPAYAFSRLESPSDFFRKSLLDYGYGTKVAKAGVARVVAPGIMAKTGRRVEVPSWKGPDKTLKGRLSWYLHVLLKMIRTNSKK